jgi:hypothetical protein
VRCYDVFDSKYGGKELYPRHDMDILFPTTIMGLPSMSGVGVFREPHASTGSVAFNPSPSFRAVTKVSGKYPWWILIRQTAIAVIDGS